jgi:hypothetical protein
MLFFTSTAACMCGVMPSVLLTSARRSADGPVPRSSPSATGSPQNIRIPRQSTTPLRPMRLSCKTAPPRRTSPSRGNPLAAGLPSPPWSNARGHGLPRPAAAFAMSPYADLTLAGATLDTKREADPQAGTHEVLLDDAIRLARQAAIADVRVTLDITAGVPDVFQNFHAMLDEGTAALDRAGQFLSAQLASAEHVTA